MDEGDKQMRGRGGVPWWLVVVSGMGLVLGVAGLGLAIFGYSDYRNTLQGFRDNGGDILGMETRAMGNVVGKVKVGVVSILAQGATATAPTEAGTGMIVTGDGYVITNRHVVASAGRISVVMDSGTIDDNLVVAGTDPLNDVAYLKIPGVTGLPTVTLGDSKNNTVGMPVWAIGYALGVYQNSVTEGNVAGLSRSIVTSSATSNAAELTDMIQTDAAINPGNSGGPLVNFQGQVVGINTSVSNNAQVLGFAIPISAAKGMLRSIVERGRAERAYLGVNYDPITPTMARARGLPVKMGNYVNLTGGSGVIAGGPADLAGVKDKDIITAIDGVEVGPRGSVLTLTGEHMSGEVVELRILRGGSEMTIPVTLGAFTGTALNF
jgi:serine protease Do